MNLISPRLIFLIIFDTDLIKKNKKILSKPSKISFLPPFLYIKRIFTWFSDFNDLFAFNIASG